MKLTADVQWPEISRCVTSPDFQFPDDVSPVVGVFGVINEMVGDVERVIRYPALGYQSPHPLPQRVLDAWDYLMKQGFTHHLMTHATISDNR